MKLLERLRKLQEEIADVVSLLKAREEYLNSELDIPPGVFRSVEERDQFEKLMANHRGGKITIRQWIQLHREQLGNQMAMATWDRKLRVLASMLAEGQHFDDALKLSKLARHRKTMPAIRKFVDDLPNLDIETT